MNTNRTVLNKTFQVMTCCFLCVFVVASVKIAYIQSERTTELRLKSLNNMLIVYIYYIKRIFEEDALCNVFLATSLTSDRDGLDCFMFYWNIDFTNDYLAICFSDEY